MPAGSPRTTPPPGPGAGPGGGGGAPRPAAPPAPPPDRAPPPLGLAPADRPIGTVALRPQERPVATLRRPVEEHGGEIRAGLVVHALPSPRPPARVAEALCQAFYGVRRRCGIAAALGAVCRQAYMQGRPTRSKRWRRGPRKRPPPSPKLPLRSGRYHNGI